MAPKVAIFLEELVEDVEFTYPYLRFKEEGFETVSVAPQRKTYKGKKGCSYVPDKVFKEVKEETFDCVYIPGGYAPDRLRRYPEILEFVRGTTRWERL